MSRKINWDDDFLNNLKKGFEPLARNEYSCIIMEADSSLMWVMVRNELHEPYHLVWKLTYQQWKNLMRTAFKYNITHHIIHENNCECKYVPVGNVSLACNEKTWLFTGTFAYFVKAVKEADKNILKLTTLIRP